MTLSQDQSELLQTAVENLNQSVAVNKEVLEIVKSVGNTGAVDIAQHNQDKTAHANGFDSLFALETLYVGSKTFYNGEPNAIRLGVETTGEYGGGTLNIYSRVNPTKQSNTSLIRFYNDVNESDANGNLSLGGINSSFRKGKQQGISHRISFARNSFGYITSFGLLEDPEHSQSSRIYYLTGNALLADSGADLGSSAFQFKDCYLQNSPIVSSDRRLKQDFESVPDAVFKAWEKVNFQQYKFKEAIAKKGDAKARKHVGLVAQDIIEAFESVGLSAFDYGIVCHDEWEDQYYDEQIVDAEAVLDAEGKVLVPEKSHMEHRLLKTAGDVYTVRYEEALALEAAYQRWKLNKIEQALSAKGISL